MSDKTEGEFKKASELEEPAWKSLEHRVKTRLEQIPKTREGRIAAILATIEAHPEGLNLQALITRFTILFGLKRETVVEYFQELERAGFTRVRAPRVYPREES